MPHIRYPSLFNSLRPILLLSTGNATGGYTFSKSLLMSWLYLLIAAIFEVGWPLGFKLSDLHPERFWTFIGLAIVSMTLSGVFLYLAQRTIPVSTAYIVWTGIGAVGTFVIGITFFGDSASLLRMFFALMILIGIVGIELTGK